MRFPGGKKKAFTISYDDNITQDERLIQKNRNNTISRERSISFPAGFPRKMRYFRKEKRILM